MASILLYLDRLQERKKIGNALVFAMAKRTHYHISSAHFEEADLRIALHVLDFLKSGQREYDNFQ